MANTKPRKRGRAAMAAAPTEKTHERAPVPSLQAGQPALPVKAVRRYIKRYGLAVDPPQTFDGFLLGGPVGRHSYAAQHLRRSDFLVASRAVTTHLRDGVIKEGDAIAEFLYAVANNNKEFKLKFGHTERPDAPVGTSDDAPTQPRADDAVPTSAAVDGGSEPAAEADHAEHAQNGASQEQKHVPMPVEPLHEPEHAAEAAYVAA